MDPQQRMLLEVVYEALEDGKSNDFNWWPELIATKLASRSTISRVPRHLSTVGASPTTTVKC